MNGNAVVLNPTSTAGVLGSYRYLLTPHSGLEVNYSFAQYTMYFQCCGNYTPNPVRVQQHELSAAYVFGLSFKNYNPFLEGGVGGVAFIPTTPGTYTLDAKQSTSIGALMGGGLAYEISPSFDIRLEYRGLLVKTPSFVDRFKTNRYEVISIPAIGVAYHF